MLIVGFGMTASPVGAQPSLTPSPSEPPATPGISSPTTTETPSPSKDPETSGTFPPAESELADPLGVPVALAHAIDLADTRALITPQVTALQLKASSMSGEYFLRDFDTPESATENAKQIVFDNFGLEPTVVGLRVDPESISTVQGLQEMASELPEALVEQGAPIMDSLPEGDGLSETLVEPPEESTSQEQRTGAATRESNYPRATGEYAPSKVVSRAYTDGSGQKVFNQQYSWNGTTNKPTNLHMAWGMELEFTLYNDTIAGGNSHPLCPSGTDDNFWAARGVANNDEVIFWAAASATKDDDDIEAYFDGFDASDPCNRSGFDIGIGFPQRISDTPSYMAELGTVIVTETGNQPSSKFSARYQAVYDDCFGMRRTSLCMNLNLPWFSSDWAGPIQGNGPFFGIAREKYVQGGYVYENGSATYLADCTITGAFGVRYNQINGGNGPLGRCDSPEIIRYPSASYTHREQNFLNGSMYWRPETGAWEVFGAIFNKYEILGRGTPGPGGVMGWPTSGELGTPNGQGRFNRFEHGNIYFGFPVGRAHMIHGAIFNRYGQEGYEGGRLGFPTSDEHEVVGNSRLVQVDFERGWIQYNFDTGQTIAS